MPTNVNIPVGSRCQVESAEEGLYKRGTVRFVGPTKFGNSVGLWVGVEYDEPFGKNDGSWVPSDTFMHAKEADLSHLAVSKASDTSPADIITVHSSDQKGSKLEISQSWILTWRKTRCDISRVLVNTVQHIRQLRGQARFVCRGYVAVPEVSGMSRRFEIPTVLRRK